MTWQELQRRARAVLPADVFTYYAGGVGDERTLRAQERAWDDVELRPRVLRDVTSPVTATTVLGTPVSTPVLVAPTAAQRMAHPDGEEGVARAAGDLGALTVVSMRSSTRLEPVAAAAGAFWQQVYVLRDRGVSDEVARRAAAAGASALVLTVDTPYVSRKQYPVPAGLPGTGIVERLDGRDLADERFQQAPDVSAGDVARLATLSGLPVVAKGVLTGAGAVDCVDAGAAAVVVSTHGGRQLDGVVPTPRALPEVVDAVGHRAEVYADGGVRTGVHVVKALALGARAVLVGRPVLWALATGGSAGVRVLLADLTAQVREALALAGCASPADVDRDLARLR